MNETGKKQAKARTKLLELAIELRKAISSFDVDTAARLAWLYSRHRALNPPAHAFDPEALAVIARFVEDLYTALDNYSECFRPQRGEPAPLSEAQAYEQVRALRRSALAASEAVLAYVDDFWAFEDSIQSPPGGSPSTT